MLSLSDTKICRTAAWDTKFCTLAAATSETKIDRCAQSFITQVLDLLLLYHLHRSLTWPTIDA